MATIIDRIRAKQEVHLPDIQAFFNRSPPVSLEFMLGRWQGLPVLTGNALIKDVEGMRWAGNDFHEIDRVDPIICYDESGARFAALEWGSARLREIKFRGTVSAAMIYNQIPMIDLFRYVDEKTVVGVVDSLHAEYPSQGEDRFYFILERIH